jgi:hypothetical protein
MEERVASAAGKRERLGDGAMKLRRERRDARRDDPLEAERPGSGRVVERVTPDPVLHGADRGLGQRGHVIVTRALERMVKRRPRGTVYVDYLQNILGKTIATAYSARASDFAGVSTPLAWDEIEAGVSNKDFTLLTYRARFRATGDLWKKVRTIKPVNIEKVLAKIERGK